MIETLLPNDLQTKNDYCKNDEVFIPYEVEQARSMPEFQRFILNHYLLTAYAKSYFDNEGHEKTMESAREIDETAEPLNSKTYGKLKRSIYRGYRSARKINRQSIKQRQRQEKILNKPKISLSIFDITTVFGVLSVLFFISGYLYNRAFFGFFGIEVSKFFTINDYLSTSIDEIYYLIISIVIGIIFNYFWWSPEYRESRLKMSKKRLLFEDFPFLLTIFLISFVAILSLVFDFPGKYIIRGFTLFILFQIFMVRFSYIFEKFSFSPMIFLVISFFFIFIIFGALHNGQMIKSYTVNVPNKYTIKLESSLKMNLKELYFLGTNSKYSFFYNHKTQKSVIIPNKFVKNISISQEVEKGFMKTLKILIEFHRDGIKALLKITRSHLSIIFF